MNIMRGATHIYVHLHCAIYHSNFIVGFVDWKSSLALSNLFVPKYRHRTWFASVVSFNGVFP